MDGGVWGCGEGLRASARGHLKGRLGPGLPQFACGSGETFLNTTKQGMSCPPCRDAGKPVGPGFSGRILLIIREAGLRVNLSRKR